ncbi:hypothetical protein ACTJJE_05005 [Mycolicibacterium sp. 22603]|uniref:hypothetical protein n=1 Tax=Mycolicibacterium sp. 22603 TaxID=3453950 RepID=UPI003F82CFE3
MTSELKKWAARKGPRWITQQIFQALTPCLLAFSVATEGHTSDLFFCGAMATIMADSGCLWTGSEALGHRARAATLTKIAQIETRTGIPMPYSRHFFCPYAYNRARNRGLGQVFGSQSVQMLIVMPLAVQHHTHSSVTFFIALVARELICRFGPFAVPTEEAAAALAANESGSPDDPLIPKHLLAIWERVR